MKSALSIFMEIVTEKTAKLLNIILCFLTGLIKNVSNNPDYKICKEAVMKKIIKAKFFLIILC